MPNDAVPIRIDDAVVARMIQERAWGECAVDLSISMFGEDQAAEDGEEGGVPEAEIRLSKLTITPQPRQVIAGEAHSDWADGVLTIEFLQGAGLTQESTLADKSKVMKVVAAYDEREILNGSHRINFKRARRDYAPGTTEDMKIRLAMIEIEFEVIRNSGTDLESNP